MTARGPVGIVAAACALALAACGGSSAYTRDGGAVARLPTRAVEWNPTHAEVGRVSAVADRGSDVVVFSEGAATVLESGSVALVDRSVPRWIGAATIPAADGGAQWIVGIDGDGRVRRLRARAGFEDVSARWGLESARVLGAARLGDGAAAFLIAPRQAYPASPYGTPPPEIAIADGQHVARFAGIPIDALAAGGGVSAGIAPGVVARIDPNARASRTFALGDASYVAVDDAGRLYAATPDAVYAENERGELALRFRASLGAIHGLVASKGRVWFAEGTELGAIEAGKVSASLGAKIGPNARLWPSTSGDVWLVDGGALARVTRDDAAPASIAPGAPSAAGPAPSPPDVAATWSLEVQPVFARACAKCHSSGGPAGVDLSSFQAWERKRDDIRARVLEQHDMPPQGSSLSAADRDAIRAWLTNAGAGGAPRPGG